MFDDFSSGYYLGRIYVEPTQEEKPVLHEQQYRKIKQTLYRNTGKTRKEKPLVFKVNNSHIKVEGGQIPSKTLGIPKKIIDDIDVENPPTLKEVLLAKPGHADNLLNLSQYSN